MLSAPSGPRRPLVGQLEEGGRKDAAAPPAPGAQVTPREERSTPPGRAPGEDAAGRPVRVAFDGSGKAAATVSQHVGAEGTLVGAPLDENDDDGAQEEEEEEEEEEGQTATTDENGATSTPAPPQCPLLVVEDWSGRPERPLLEAIVGPTGFFPPSAPRGAGGGLEFSRRFPWPNPVIVVDDWSSKAPARPAGVSSCLAGLDAEAGSVPKEGGEQQQDHCRRRHRLRRVRTVHRRLYEEQYPLCPALLSSKSTPVHGGSQTPVYCALR